MNLGILVNYVLKITLWEGSQKMCWACTPKGLKVFGVAKAEWNAQWPEGSHSLQFTVQGIT